MIFRGWRPNLVTLSPKTQCNHSNEIAEGTPPLQAGHVRGSEGPVGEAEARGHTNQYIVLGRPREASQNWKVVIGGCGCFITVVVPMAVTGAMARLIQGHGWPRRNLPSRTKGYQKAVAWPRVAFAEGDSSGRWRSGPIYF